MNLERGLCIPLSAMVLSSSLAIVEAAPSFDCSGVTPGSTEEMICSDAELSALDREVDRLYRKIKAQTTEEDFRGVQTSQRGWIKGRNESWKANDPRQSVLDAYKERIAVLSIQAGEVMAPKPVSYECTGGEFEMLVASFYDTTPPVGVFTRTPGGDWPQYIATGWEDEEAIHYNIGGLDFVERDGHADLNWAGTLMNCERRSSD